MSADNVPLSTTSCLLKLHTHTRREERRWVGGWWCVVQEEEGLQSGVNDGAISLGTRFASLPCSVLIHFHRRVVGSPSGFLLAFGQPRQRFHSEPHHDYQRFFLCCGLGRAVGGKELAVRRGQNGCPLGAGIPQPRSRTEGPRREQHGAVVMCFQTCGVEPTGRRTC